MSTPSLTVGDRVRVSTRRYGDSQYNKIGTVTVVGRRGVHHIGLDIEIRYDKPLGGLWDNQYRTADLEVIELKYDPSQQGDTDEDI